MGFLTTGANTTDKLAKFAPASSFLETVEYDEKNRSMDITFKTGSKVRYLNVFPAAFLSFQQSPTHSAFYARAIKGNLLAVQIVQNDIGRPRSTPLKTISKEQPLDRGLNKQRAGEDRIWGTVERAFNQVAVNA